MAKVKAGMSGKQMRPMFKKKAKSIKTSAKFKGKSNKLGYGAK